MDDPLWLRGPFPLHHCGIGTHHICSHKYDGPRPPAVASLRLAACPEGNQECDAVLRSSPRRPLSRVAVPKTPVPKVRTGSALRPSRSR